MGKFGSVKILQEINLRAELKVGLVLGEDYSSVDLELIIPEDIDGYYSFKADVSFKDYAKFISLFSEESENYLKTVVLISFGPDFNFYAGMDKEGNKYLGFKFYDDKIYFLWKDILLDFMINPSKKTFNIIEKASDKDLNTKFFLKTNTAKVEIVLKEIVKKIEGHFEYQEYDMENKQIFFKQSFTYFLKKSYNISLDDIEDVEKANISYLYRKFFESTL